MYSPKVRILLLLLLPATGILLLVNGEYTLGVMVLLASLVFGFIFIKKQ